MKGAIFLLLAFCAFGYSQGVLTKDTDMKMDINNRLLHFPSLDELKTVLTKGLSKNYAEVSVEIIDCPDLRKPPFNLAASGLGGNPRILDIGGPDAHPVKGNNPFDLDTIVSRTGAEEKAFIIGAAQGPLSHPFGQNEVVVNLVLNSPASYPGLIAAIPNETNDKFSIFRYPGNETGITFVGNVLVSKGQPGKVLQVHVKKRIGKISAFPDSMQKTLAEHYLGKLVGLGGTFLSKSGKVTHHVISSPDTGSKFVYHNISAPIITAGVILSAEMDLKFTPYHFHSYSDHNEGGHYDYDVSPDEMEYMGYFTPGKMVSRVKIQHP